MRNKIIDWLTLIRLPNLFTVPGDIFIGYFLTLPSPKNHYGLSFFLLLFVSLALYTSGIILNDWFDLDRDKVERSNRPLVSGQVAPFSALLVIICLVISALIIAAFVGKSPLYYCTVKTCFLSKFFLLLTGAAAPFGCGPAALYIAALLALLIYFYNSSARRIPAVGFLVMGLCRGINIILGASLNLTAMSSVLWSVVAAETCYVIAVTMSAFQEHKRAPDKLVRRLPFIIIFLGFIYPVYLSSMTWISFLGVSVAVGNVLYISITMKENLQPYQVQKKLATMSVVLFPYRPRSFYYIIRVLSVML